MQKKGVSGMFLAITSAVLALLVIFVLGSIFNVGVTNIFSKFMGITDSAELQAGGTGCNDFIAQRSCYADRCPQNTQSVSGTWDDCPPKDKDGNKIEGKENQRFCCQQVDADSTDEKDSNEG